MKLEFSERLALLSVLPAEGTFVTLRIVRELRDALSPSEDEIKRFGIKQVDETQVRWNPGVDTTAEVPIGEKATDIIVAALKGLDDQAKLTEQHVSVFEKFVT